MDELLAYCGLVCSTCPIYEATRIVDRKEQLTKRAEISRLCKEQYGLQYEPADITDCDGCTATTGRIFSGCVQCAIRACAQQKGVLNCAFCSQYACQQLVNFFASDPAAKTRLDEIKRSMA